MRLHRFYVKQPLGEELVVDSKDLLHQWASVFRLTAGDKVLLFSSSPNDFLYEIVSLSKTTSLLRFVSQQKNIEIKKNTTLFLSLLKKDTFEDIVRQTTELGISRIVPIHADRSEKKSLNFERLQIIAKEATEQCGRGDMPIIEEIMALEDAFNRFPDITHIVASLNTKTVEFPKNEKFVGLWVGPEGGWSEKEEAFFKNVAFSTISLGETTLKADTASIALVTLALR